MRGLVFSMVVAFGLAACSAQFSAQFSAQDRVSETPEAALRGYYAQLDVTLPAKAAGAGDVAAGAPVSRIAFGSCIQQDEPIPALQAMAAMDPDLAVLLGDNVYGDAYRGDMSLPELRDAYADLAANPDFQALNDAVPLMTVWDDHDYGMNDAGATFSAREFAEEVYLTFWGAGEDDPRRDYPGVYYSQMLGEPGQEVHMIVLDTRYFRSDLVRASEQEKASGLAGRYGAHTDPDAAMLGEAQWAWLEGELAKPSAVKIVVTSIQVIADGHLYEKWGLYPAERERLYAAIDAAGPAGLVMVSGDRHRAGIYKHERADGYPLYELTTSSLNKPVSAWGGREEPGPNRVGPTYLEENFGVIDVDWDAGTLVLSIMAENGEVVQAVTLDMADMAAG